MEYIDVINNSSKYEVASSLQYLDKSVDDLYSYLSEDDIKLLDNYTKKYNRNIKKYLLESMYIDKDLQKQVDRLTDIINMSKSNEKLTIFRGACLDSLGKLAIKQDNIYTTRTFYSTTLNPFIAKDFMQSTSFIPTPGHTGLILQLELPYNYPMLYLHPFSSCDEQEVLFAPGMRFEVTSSSKEVDKEYNKEYVLLKGKIV